MDLRKYLKKVTLLFFSCILLSTLISCSIINFQTKTSSALTKKIICIDPGHEEKPNYHLEAIAPQSSIKKIKVSPGTRGKFSKIPEYIFNLNFSLKLEKILKQNGAKVVMTRNRNNVQLSNIERAKIGNQNLADLVIRIHADGDSDPNQHGIRIFYPGKLYVKNRTLRLQSKLAAETIGKVLKQNNLLVLAIKPRDDLTGFNWSTRPVILIECGFMTNKKEDLLLNNPQYQIKLANFITKGVINYFNQ